MKLSDAILLGSVGTDQDFGVYGSNYRTCALGAALKAEGQLIVQSWNPGVDNTTKVRQLWPWVMKKIQYCPECGASLNVPLRLSEGITVMAMITHLNDYHRWPRPQIAAWVATIEPQEAPVTVQAPEEKETDANRTHA